MSDLFRILSLLEIEWDFERVTKIFLMPPKCEIINLFSISLPLSFSKYFAIFISQSLLLSFLPLTLSLSLSIFHSFSETSSYPSNTKTNWTKANIRNYLACNWNRTGIWGLTSLYNFTSIIYILETTWHRHNWNRTGSWGLPSLYIFTSINYILETTWHRCNWNRTGSWGIPSLYIFTSIIHILESTLYMKLK